MKETKERPVQKGEPGLGFYLDAGDLAELRLRQLYFEKKNLPPSLRGALSFPRYMASPESEVGKLISMLNGLGRVQVKEKLARTIAPGASGNIVVYPQQDKSVQATLPEADINLLDPVLRIFSTGMVPIESVTVLPNTSANKPKGIILRTKPNTDKWWRRMQELNWALGRGLRIIFLGMDACEFIDRSDEILISTFGASQNFPKGSLKYVQFLHDADGLMYMAVAGGPSVEESEAAARLLAGTPRQQRAAVFAKDIERFYRNRREIQATELCGEIGLAQNELLTDTPYIGLDIETGAMYSGATSEAYNGLIPFTVGTQGVVLRADNPNDIVPIGAKLPEMRPDSNPIVPPGVTIHELTKGSASMFPPQEIQAYIDSFQRPITLYTLALAYHADWR